MRREQECHEARSAHLEQHFAVVVQINSRCFEIGGAGQQLSPSCLHIYIRLVTHGNAKVRSMLIAFLNFLHLSTDHSPDERQAVRKRSSCLNQDACYLLLFPAFVSLGVHIQKLCRASQHEHKWERWPPFMLAQLNLTPKINSSDSSRQPSIVFSSISPSESDRRASFPLVVRPSSCKPSAHVGYMLMHADEGGTEHVLDFLNPRLVSPTGGQLKGAQTPEHYLRRRRRSVAMVHGAPRCPILSGNMLTVNNFCGHLASADKRLGFPSVADHWKSAAAGCLHFPSSHPVCRLNPRLAAMLWGGASYFLRF